MKCYLCGSAKQIQRPGRVRDNNRLRIHECRSCGLVFLSSFKHIKEDFYERSGMHASEISVENWLKETAADDERRLRLLKPYIRAKSVLDFGCGNGGFLERAGALAARVSGLEPEKRLKAHFLKKGLKVFSKLAAVKEKQDIITMFHVLEHLPDPRKALRSLAGKIKRGGRIIVEVPNSEDALLSLYKCGPFSEFTYWSCHLFLFNAATLSSLAGQAGYKVDFVRHIQRYPLSNHLYWLSEGKPGGHAKWPFIDSPELKSAYENSLARRGITDTIMAGLSL